MQGGSYAIPPAVPDVVRRTPAARFSPEGSPMRPRSVTVRARVRDPARTRSSSAPRSSSPRADRRTRSAKASVSTTSTTTADSTSTAVVKTATDPRLGTILVDADGKTLYTLTNGGQAVACTGGCLTAWPPLLLPAGTTTATGSGRRDQARDDRRRAADLQVTQAGLPLYRFAADTAAGDANGEGAHQLRWHLARREDQRHRVGQLHQHDEEVQLRLLRRRPARCRVPLGERGAP